MAEQEVGGRIEQRALLRKEKEPPSTTVLVRGGVDTRDKLRRHAKRTARAWSLDGKPLLGISVFAALGSSLEDLLRRRFASFRMVICRRLRGLPGTASIFFPPGSTRTSPCV